jgi:hypothetical protein
VDTVGMVDRNAFAIQPGWWQTLGGPDPRSDAIFETKFMLPWSFSEGAAAEIQCLGGIR